MANDNVTYPDVGSITGGKLSEIRPEDRDHALKGAQILVRCLALEGVEVVFGYPGGANLEIFDVLDEAGITCIRVEHEQGAVHAAQGYARASGRVGVCLATSGPGATNLVTGIADANSDSTPIVAITGNVPSHLLGRNAFQEVDIVAIVRPVTKRAWLVASVDSIPTVVRQAFALARGNRPGPVLIDIPKDIQQHYPRDGLANYLPPQMPASLLPLEPAVNGMVEAQLLSCVAMIGESARTVLYVGGGIVAAGAEAQLLAVAERIDAPVVTTIMGIGAFPVTHPLSLDVLGMHGAYYANIAINEADLVIALGVRFDDRVTGNVAEFIKVGKIIHIDIDAHELNKNKVVTLAVHADLRFALGQLVAALQPTVAPAWRAYCAELKKMHPYPVAAGEAISPQRAIASISQHTAGEAIVTTGVGQHQMWAMQHYRAAHTRCFISSSGFGTMGFGLPAAIGAKQACPERIVIDIDGDGGLNMSIHELSTCHRYGIGVKVVVINNQWLGMVGQWQDMVYAGKRSHSILSDPLAGADIYPDFVTIARGYGVQAERVTRIEDLSRAIARAFADPDVPYLLDIIVDAAANVYPMIPAGATYRQTIMNDSQLSASSGDEQGANV